jgi:serine/threonine-protein phosphatase 6 regulatory ankyrin repeat subunit B
VTRENLEAIKESVEHDVDLNQEYGLRPLQYAMQNNNDRIIEYYLEQGVELNYLDRFGQTPLMYGCGAGASTSFPMRLSVEQVEMLIEHGADVNMRATNGKTALDYALIDGKLRVILLLLDKGAQVDATTWNYYLKNKSKLDDPIYGDSNLQYKIRHELLSRYLEADPAAESGYDAEALFTAATYSSLEIMEYLLENGGDPNMPYESETALVPAVMQGELAKVKLLVEHGADIEYIGEDGTKDTVIDLAARTSNHILEYLLDQGALIDFQNRKGITALMNAISVGHVDNVKLLIERGADPTLKNREGETALSIAQAGKNEEIIAMVEDYLEQWKA